ncbi:hypothetical protein HOLleu_44124 [Holothuria leucospilota]|uniref:Uncharacterized protein n=1 Tax=Holothuria leucospilota TaxID=206669 RepID=A0A9Q1B8S4_HOLLE|nr:hypothetical protein HOLleu_44124 [Holothuria leucospilota]
MCLFLSLYSLTRYLKKGNLDSSQTWYRDAPYKEKELYCFGRGQRSLGVTRGQTLKTLLTQYLEMWYGKRKNRVIFEGGQRSPGVTGGQTLKTLLSQYLEIRRLDEFHTLYVDAL